MFEQLGIIGCGLIGGSFGLAMRHGGRVRRIVGYSKSPASVQRALQLGVIDAAAGSAAQAVAGCDIVLLAVPVSATETTLRAIREHLEPGVLVMDVGSTKRDVVDAARRVLRDRIASFVPAHPIAGKESAGVDHADGTLFTGRQVILTPLAQTPAEHVEAAARVWSAFGAQVSTMTPEQHDEAFAAVSHLPHLLAFAFFNAIRAQQASRDHLALAGPGFRDFTRIAASDPTIWRDILCANREQVLEQSRLFREALAAFEQAMKAADADALEALIRPAATGRARWKMAGGGTPPRRG